MITTSFRHILLLGIVFVAALSAHGQVKPSDINDTLLKKSMEEVLGSYQNLEWSTVSLGALNKDELDLKQGQPLPDTLFFGAVQTEEGQRWIIPDIAPSKSELFSFVLYLDGKKEIVDVDVLDYRESYGYEIDYPYFREQFHGKSESKEVRFGRSIQNISGATISARSITHAVHDLLSILNHIDLAQ